MGPADAVYRNGGSSDCASSQWMDNFCCWYARRLGGKLIKSSILSRRYLLVLGFCPNIKVMLLLILYKGLRLHKISWNFDALKKNSIFTLYFVLSCFQGLCSALFSSDVWKRCLKPGWCDEVVTTSQYVCVRVYIIMSIKSCVCEASGELYQDICKIWSPETSKFT